MDRMSNRRRRGAKRRRRIAQLHQRLSPSPWGLTATTQSIDAWFMLRIKLRQLEAQE
jgi:hypothetical protein